MDRSAIDALKDRTDIVKIIGQYVELRKSGSSWMGRCPFHEDRAPSFSVRSEPPTFVCFGCGEKGDVFKFLMLRERVSFPEAFRLVNGPEFKPMSPPPEPRKVEGRPGQPQARKVNWDEPWALMLMHIAPGDPVTLMLGDNAIPEDVAKLRSELGLDKPILVQYWDFLSRAVVGDFGRSLKFG